MMINSPTRPFWVSDPGHAWLCVPLSAVKASGFIPSNCSFRTSELAFLEEDCDAPGFLRATNTLDAARDYPVRQVEEFNRSLRRFR